MKHLLFWRHAEAQDTSPDLERALTQRGLHQAELMGNWLRPRMPAQCQILVSPARRTQQTLAALRWRGAAPIIEPRIAPGASVTAVLAAIHDHSEHSVLVVGHQPWIGLTIGKLLTGQETYWSVRKNSLWWLTHENGDAHWTLRALADPDLL